MAVAFLSPVICHNADGGRCQAIKAQPFLAFWHHRKHFYFNFYYFTFVIYEKDYFLFCVHFFPNFSSLSSSSTITNV